MTTRKTVQRPPILTGQAAKAHWAAILMFLATVQQTMLTGGYTSFAEISSLQWTIIATATLTAWGVTYGISNTEPKGPAV